MQDAKNVSFGTAESTLTKEGKAEVELTPQNLVEDSYNLTLLATSGSVTHSEYILVQRDAKDQAILIQTDKVLISQIANSSSQLISINK